MAGFIFVTDIWWERVFVHFTVESHADDVIKEFRLRSGRLGIVTPTINCEKTGDNTYHLFFNITAANGRDFLDNSNWNIIAITEDPKTHEEGDIICSCSYDLAYRIADYTRIFRYGTGLYMYTVAFAYAVRDDDPDQFYFMIRSHFVTENDDWRKRKYLREDKRAGGRTSWTIKRRFNINLMRMYYKVASALNSKNGNRIMLMTETKDFLWGNLKYIDDRIKERGLDDRFEITYNFRAQVGGRSSIFSWFSLIRKIARQDYIFVDDYVPIFGWLDLDPQTKLIQVWHAGEGFKSVGYSRFGKRGSPYPIRNCHKMYDYVITGSQRLVHTYEEVFGIDRTAFLPLGMARLDGYLDPEKIDEFKKEFYSKYPQFQGKKLILFAPTFRGKNQRLAYYDYDQLDLKRIYEFCGSEYIWAFKIHPFVSEAPAIPKEYSDRIVDLSSWQNINDLYYVTDLMITDYSSSYYDYGLLRRPVLFFTYDRLQYELMRGVHKSVLETAPGKVCDTFDELMEALEKKDYEFEKMERFADEQFGDYDGHAADRIIDTILLKEGEWCWTEKE